MPTVLLAISIIGGCVLFGALGAFLTRRHLRRVVSALCDDTLVAVFLTAGVVYAVLLGFMVVAVWQSYDAAHANAAEEATLLVPLYRQTETMAPAQGAQMRTLLRSYAANVADLEWASLATTGKPSEAARKDTGDMLRVYAALDPATKAAELVDAQFLTTYNQLLLDRNKRLFEASDSVSWIMWLAAIGGGAIVVAMSWFLAMDGVRVHVAMIGAMSGMIGLLFFVMAALGSPYSGPMALEAAPFHAALQIFSDIDRGN